MAYDASNDAIVLFSGSVWDNSGEMNDTWAYSWGSNLWTEKHPAVSPPARRGHGLVYDSLDGVSVLFGGSGDGRLNDTWAYNYSTNTWTELHPPSAPSMRVSHAMAYDCKDNVVLVFGGMAAGATDLSDIWAYSYEDNRWEERKSPNAPPPPYDDVAMAYDSRNDVTILFNGLGTWAYHYRNDTWMKRAPAISPEYEIAPTMVYDESAGVAILKGFSDHTWTYNYTQDSWTPTTPNPDLHTYTSMVYDSKEGLSLVYAGHNADSSMFSTYRASTDTWSQRWQADSHPRHMEGPFAYDVQEGVTVFLDNEGSETWTYSMRNDTWTRMRPTLAPSPQGGSDMVYDSQNRVVVLFGWYEIPSNQSHEDAIGTWTYSLANDTWTNMHPSTSPPARWGHAMTYDEVFGVVILFGGELVNDEMGPGKNLNDTWTYDARSNNWTRMEPSTSPSARRLSDMVYEPNTGLSVLFGGFKGGFNGHSSGDVLNDTWLYNLTLDEWTEVRCNVSPPQRFELAMAQSPREGRVLLFGGFLWFPIDVNGYCDTWEFDAVNLAWKEYDVEVAPPARTGHSLIYDKANDAVLLCGGYRSDYWVFKAKVYQETGSYTSRPFDLGGEACFGSVSWTADMPTGTAIELQVRTAASIDGLLEAPFVGPDGEAGSHYRASGATLAGAHDGTRWLQYRAFLRTARPSETPILGGVEIAYNLIQTVSVSSPRDGAVLGGIVNVSWDARDYDGDALLFDLVLIHGTVEARLATDLSVGTRSWSWDTTSVPDGTYRIMVTAKDDDPLIPIERSAISGNLTVDNEKPPTVAIYLPIPAACYKGPLIASGTAGDDHVVARVEVRLDHGEWAVAQGSTGWSHPIDTTSLIAGTHMMEARTFDGVHYSDIACVVFLTDQPPIVAIFSPSDGNTVNGTLVVSGISFDDVGVQSVQSLVDGGTWSDCEGTTTWRYSLDTTRLSSGKHLLAVRCRDAWWTSSHATLTFNVDQVPTVSFIKPGSGLTWSGMLAVECSASDDLQVELVQLRVDGDGAWTATETMRWSTEIDTTVLARGDHTLYARAYDGIQWSMLATTPFRVDQPPQVIILQPSGTLPIHADREGRIAVAGTAVDDGEIVLVEVRIDRGEWMTVQGKGTWSAHIPAGALLEGQHLFEARCSDGSQYSTTASSTFSYEIPETHNGTHAPSWPIVAILLILLCLCAGLVLARGRRAR